MPKVLIVDDEKAIRNTLKEILEFEGFETEEAEDGPTAIQKFMATNDFDVVLCDIKMPKMDGTGLFKAMIVGIDERFQPDHILILSGHIPEAKNNKTIGRVTHMSKPLNPENFTNYLRERFPNQVRTA